MPWAAHHCIIDTLQRISADQPSCWQELTSLVLWQRLSSISLSCPANPAEGRSSSLSMASEKPAKGHYSLVEFLPFAVSRLPYCSRSLHGGGTGAALQCCSKTGLSCLLGTVTPCHLLLRNSWRAFVKFCIQPQHLSQWLKYDEITQVHAIMCIFISADSTCDQSRLMLMMHAIHGWCFRPG